jgi:hypothetical protein
VLSPSRAARLAARATRRRADGSRGLLTRRAWRRLATAGDSGDQAAVSAAWEEWLRAPSDELWEALSCWQGRQPLAEAAFEAGIDPDHTPGERAAIGAFCTERGVAPQDAVRRAVFYVLTGQAAQHRAADPDGRLLAVGYGLAGERARTALRDALASAGDLDIVRVVGEGRQLSAAERDYLSQHLAGRCDWDGLWRLVRDLPLTEAVAAMQLFGDGWRPASEGDRAMFARLARAEPAAIARSGEALAAPVVIDVKTDGRVFPGSFSPDGRQLLVAVVGVDDKYSGVRVFDLPGGTLLERHDYPGGLPPPAVVHLGSAFLVVGHRTEGVWELVRYAGGQPRVFHWSRFPMYAAAHPAGFVVLEVELRARWRLMLYDAAGEMLSDSHLYAGPQPGQPSDWGGPNQVVTDPVTGRIAVSGDDVLVLAADGSSVLAGTQMPPWSFHGSPRFFAACFTGPDSVVALETGGLRRYRIAGSRLEPEASVLSQTSATYCPLAAIPHRGEIAARGREGQVSYLDAETLTEKIHSEELGGSYGTEFWGSTDGRSQALSMSTGTRHFVRVVWGGYAASQLAARPLGGMGPDALAVATAALQAETPRLEAGPFLRLLRDCLRPRFETDVGLAEARPAPGGDDDVGLAAGEWPG